MKCHMRYTRCGASKWREEAEEARDRQTDKTDDGREGEGGREIEGHKKCRVEETHTNWQNGRTNDWGRGSANGSEI